MMTFIRAALVLVVLCRVVPAPAHAEEIIQHTSGTGHRHLQPFTVKDGWELRWEVTGDNSLLQVVIDRVNPPPDIAIDSVTIPGPAKGQKMFAKGGTYYLRVIGLAGNWMVTVAQGP